MKSTKRFSFVTTKYSTPTVTVVLNPLRTDSDFKMETWNWQENFQNQPNPSMWLLIGKLLKPLLWRLALFLKKISFSKIYKNCSQSLMDQHSQATLMPNQWMRYNNTIWYDNAHKTFFHRRCSFTLLTWLIPHQTLTRGRVRKMWRLKFVCYLVLWSNNTHSHRRPHKTKQRSLIRAGNSVWFSTAYL